MTAHKADVVAGRRCGQAQTANQFQVHARGSKAGAGDRHQVRDAARFDVRVFQGIPRGFEREFPRVALVAFHPLRRRRAAVVLVNRRREKRLGEEFFLVRFRHRCGRCRGGTFRIRTPRPSGLGEPLWRTIINARLEEHAVPPFDAGSPVEHRQQPALVFGLGGELLGDFHRSVLLDGMPRHGGAQTEDIKAHAKSHSVAARGRLS